jgi:hypothetical protein
MNEIIFPKPNELFVVVGGKSATPHMIDLAVRLALSGPLLILDGGNSANPYPMARELRRHTLDPVRFLQQIQIARAFTCHQVVALLEQTIESGQPRQPVLIFDLLSTFYDESISIVESRRLLECALQAIQVLNRLAPIVVSARQPLNDFPQRKVFFTRLCEIASQVWEEVPVLEEKPVQMAFPLAGGD